MTKKKFPPGGCCEWNAGQHDWTVRISEIRERFEGRLEYLNDLLCHAALIENQETSNRCIALENEITFLKETIAQFEDVL